MNTCQKKAISMVEDECGYIYPEIKKELCVKCGLCKKVCSFTKEPYLSEKRNAYACIAMDKNIRKVSASGGIFASIATEILKNNGVVFGSEMVRSENGLLPQHRMIEKVEELYLLQSSKYAQSDIGYVFKDVKDFLNQGRLVLFSGTSCQIAALRSYLQNKEYENLFLIDLICHGVPSARILQGYQKMLEERYKMSLDKINFRDKEQGWGEKGLISLSDPIKGKKKNVKISPVTSSFYKLYLMGAFYRENCYVCPYTDIGKRPGDLTIGDFWGIERVHPEYLSSNGGPWDRGDGISCLIVNTENGEKLIREYGTEIEYKEATTDQITLRNKMLCRPPSYFLQRKTVLRLFQEHGYKGVDNWFWHTYGMKLRAQRIRRKIPIHLQKKQSESCSGL